MIDREFPQFNENSICNQDPQSHAMHDIELVKKLLSNNK